MAFEKQSVRRGTPGKLIIPSTMHWQHIKCFYSLSDKIKIKLMYNMVTDKSSLLANPTITLVMDEEFSTEY